MASSMYPRRGISGYGTFETVLSATAEVSRGLECLAQCWCG